ncbi:hypothetical protein PF011_g20688 [Phytophthora fragariae]|uniref:Uncharacterized protein n=1 Tax=Phytophthora fragariae TaxID=53985 RepID=A0A6A3IRH4_9STRA|nr:hypothetical protein PF011_g20688 [Phytophthora fragariae]
MDLTEDEDGYNSSTGSVDEDAELELSFALHDLALRVKTFEANMQGRFRQGLGDEEDEEEITEDIDRFEDEGVSSYCSKHQMDSDSASPKRRVSRRRRSSGFKTAKHQHVDEEEAEDYEDLDSDEEDRPEAKSGRDDSELSGEEEEWDSQEEKEELCELKQNIAKLLQSMQEEAKALEDNQAGCKFVE